MSKLNLLKTLLFIFSGILFYQGVPSLITFLEASSFNGLSAGAVVVAIFFSLFDIIAAVSCLTFAWHAQEYLQKWPLAFKFVATSLPALMFLNVLFLFLASFNEFNPLGGGITLLIYGAILLVIGSAMVNLVSAARNSLQ